jgi:hypothetical protein
MREKVVIIMLVVLNIISSCSPRVVRTEYIDSRPHIGILLPEIRPNFLNSDSISIVELNKCLDYYSIKCKNVVLVQALLESSHFKSNNFILRKNLFGLTGQNGKYMKFNHWHESVKAYSLFIQARFKPPSEDYFSFLKRIKYAKDKKYIYKLKQMVEWQKVHC